MLNVTTNVFVASIGVFTGTLLARLLGPQGSGEFAAIQSWPLSIGNFAQLGTAPALIYYSGREPNRAAGYLGSAGVTVLLASGPFMLVAYLLMPTLLAAQSPAVVHAARLYLLVVPFVGLMNLSFCSIRGRADFVTWNLFRMIQLLAWAALLVGAWVVDCRKPQLVAYAYLVEFALLSFLIAATVKRQTPGSLAPRAKEFVALLRYGLPCIATSLPVLFNKRLDQMLLAAFMPSAQLGLYVVAVAWSESVNLLLSAVSSALFPKIAMEPNEDRRARAFAQGSRLAALLSVVTGIVLMVATRRGMVLFFGQKFEGAVTAALILVPAGAVAGYNLVVEEGLRGLGYPGSILRAESAGLVTTVISLALLLRPFGIVGASIASLAGYSTTTAILLTQARWLTGASTSALLFPNFDEINTGIQQIRLLFRKAIA